MQGGRRELHRGQAVRGTHRPRAQNLPKAARLQAVDLQLIAAGSSCPGMRIHMLCLHPLTHAYIYAWQCIQVSKTVPGLELVALHRSIPVRKRLLMEAAGPRQDGTDLYVELCARALARQCDSDEHIKPC